MPTPSASPPTDPDRTAICTILRANAASCRRLARRATADAEDLAKQAAEYERLADALECCA